MITLALPLEHHIFTNYQGMLNVGVR